MSDLNRQYGDCLILLQEEPQKLLAVIDSEPGWNAWHMETLRFLSILERRGYCEPLLGVILDRYAKAGAFLTRQNPASTVC